MSPIPQEPAGQAVALLRALATDVDGTRRSGFLGIPRWAGSGFRTDFIPAAGDLSAAASRALHHAEAHNVYVATQLLRHIPPPDPHTGRQRRGGKADTLGLVAVTADVDVAGPGHSEKTDTKLPLPPTPDEALRILDRVLAPTCLIWTGGGWQAWWLLRTLADLPVPEAERISQGWVTLLRAHAADLGYHLDKTGDLARVLRLPGTINHKYPERPVVEILATGPRYGLDELAALVPPPAPQPERKPVIIRPVTGGTSAADITARWSAETDWGDLLGPAGWPCHRDNGHGERHWTRPGKDHGTSAVSHDDPPVVHVFTFGSDLPGDTTLTKLEALAHLQFGGDVRAAWHAIAPPLANRLVDPASLVEFVARNGPNVAGRLVWATRRAASLPERDTAIRALIRAAVESGMSLPAAVRTTEQTLRTPAPARSLAC